MTDVVRNCSFKYRQKVVLCLGNRPLYMCHLVDLNCWLIGTYTLCMHSHQLLRKQ